MRDHILGEICQIRADAPMPERFVEIEAAALIGVKPPDGGALLRKIMYVGEAAEVVASALRWERNAEREVCARIAEEYAERQVAHPDCGDMIAESIRARSGG
jgi:hypothetical protein